MSLSLTDLFLVAGIGYLAGFIAYTYDDDDGIVLFYGKVLWSKAVYPLIAVAAMVFAWAMDALDWGWLLAGLAFFLGFAVAGYMMSIFWPTWELFVAWLGV